MNWKTKRPSQTAPWMLLILAVFYLLGVFLGQAASGLVSPELQTELDRYLKDFLCLDKEQISVAESAWNTLLLYIRYPLMAFFLGFASVGAVLLPCLALLFGLGLSFSVSCFTAAFGAVGMQLAWSSFGLRVLVTLPCFLLVAVPAWEASLRLLALSFGRGRRATTVLYDRAYWLRFCMVMAVLLAGVCGDLLLTPWLLSQVLM